MQNLESKYDYKKNRSWKRKHFEILRLEVFTKWENWRELRNYELTNSLYNNWEESHDMIQKLTSQIQELQERVNCKSDSGEFQEIESNYSRQFFTFPVNPAVVPSPQSMLSSNRSMPFDTWNLSETQGNVFGNPRFSSIQLRHLIKEFFTLRIQMPQVRFQWERMGAQHQCRYV